MESILYIKSGEKGRENNTTKYGDTLHQNIKDTEMLSFKF